MTKEAIIINLLTIFTPVAVLIIPWFLRKMQALKKEKIIKISEVTKYISSNIEMSMRYIFVSFLSTIPIYIILNLICYELKINKIDDVRHVIALTVIIMLPLLHLFYPKSKRIRKDLLDLLCGKKAKNLILFYLPTLITIIEILVSIYIKFDNKNLYNAIVTIIMFLSIAIILLYFMSYKSYDKYETVIIHFTNSYNYDDIIRYSEFSIEDGFIVIRKKVDNKYILRKYNCNIVADIEIVGIDKDEEYLKYINKRGFKK